MPVRRWHVKSWAVGAALSVVVLAACDGSGTGAGQTPAAPEPTADGIPTPSVSQAEQYAIDHGVEVPTDAVVREITPDESVTVIAACMEEAGWSGEIDAEGAASYDIPEGQVEAFDAASARCRAMYPVAERYARPFTAEQWGIIYDHWADVTIPCLREQGYQPAELPTREAFIEESLQRTSTGYVLNEPIWDDVQADVTNGRWPSQRHLYEVVCPDQPPEDVLYGSE